MKEKSAFLASGKDQIKGQPIAPNPRWPQLWMDSAGGKKQPAYWGLDEKKSASSTSLLSQAWVTSLSTEHLHRPKPHGKFSKSASGSIVV